MEIFEENRWTDILIPFIFRYSVSIIVIIIIHHDISDNQYVYCSII